MDSIVTLIEAARQLGLKKHEAVRLVRSRQLKAIQAGRSFVIRVKQSEIDRFKNDTQKDAAV